MAKNRKSQARRKQQRKQRKEQKRKVRRKQERKRQSTPDVPRPELRPIDPPTTQGCLPPRFVDATGSVVPDPYALLGLPLGCHDPDRVRTAYRDGLGRHPPEQEPELARQLRDARDRLLDPERLVERELGVLHVPAAPAIPELAEPAGERLDGNLRLAAQAVLYALVEEAVEER